MALRLSVLVVFVLVYAFLVLSTRHRAEAVGIGVALLLVCGQFLAPQDPERILSLSRILQDAINWNIIGLLAGAMMIADSFVDSRAPVVLANWVITRCRSAHFAFLSVCVLSGLISMFVDNVTTVLIVSPVALAIARRANLSPVTLLIGIAVSANLQGAATLMGDPPSMILAGSFKMTFNDFFFHKGKPSVFFAMQVGAVAGCLVLYAFFRRHRSAKVSPERERVRSWVPTIFVGVMIAFLASASAFDPDFRWLAGTGVIGLGLGALAWNWQRHPAAAVRMLKRYDLPTILFLAGIFVIAYSVQGFGWVERAAWGIASLVGERRLLAFMIVVWSSVLLSGFVDNIAYVAAMLPVTKELAAAVGGDPFLYAAGLLIGACLGGNITPIGAACNVVAVGILRREGYSVSFWEFVKMGLPFAVAATAAGSAVIWAFWH